MQDARQKNLFWTPIFNLTLVYHSVIDEDLMADISPQQVETLYQEAWQALRDENVVEAMAKSDALIKLKQESGYQLKVMLLLEADRLPEALDLVQEGVEAQPDSWSLALLYTDLLSLDGQGEEALKIIENTRELEGVESHWVDISEATVRGRMMDIDQALNLLQKIEHPDAINAAIEMQFALLDSVGRHDLIIEVAEEDLSLLEAPEDANEAAVLSRIMSQVAQAYWYEEEDEDTVEHYLELSIAYDRSNPDALYLRRELDGLFSEQSRTFELELRGVWEGDHEESAEEKPYQTHYQVIADSEEEALALIQSYEPKHLSGPAMKIVQSRSEPNPEEELKGVYLVSPLDF